MEIVAQLVRDAGFDAVIVGALARGKEFEPARAYTTPACGKKVQNAGMLLFRKVR